MKWLGLVGVVVLMALASCGKVVQQTSDETAIPVWSLSFAVPMTGPTLNQAERVPSLNLSHAPLQVGPTTNMTVLVTGVNTAQSKQLAYSILKWRQPHGVAAYDKKGIKVKAPLRPTQVQGAVVSGNALVTLSTTALDARYAFYMIATFTQAETYRLKVIDQSVVSENKGVVQLDTLTVHDTFRSLLFKAAFETTNQLPALHTLINQVFDEALCTQLAPDLPPLEAALLSGKTPVLRVNSTRIRAYLTLLEQLLVSKEDALAYLETQDDDVFTKKQRAALQEAVAAMPHADDA